ncbi:MAG: hypothetical protein QM697_02755 [Lachnospiraceae bacterium]
MRNKAVLICLLMTALLAAAYVTFWADVFSEKEAPAPPVFEVQDPSPNASVTVTRESDTEAEKKENEDRYPWEQPVVPIAGFSGELPTIVCWGDSLTESIDGKAYPDFLRKLTQTEVVNYGVRAETAKAIAIREGAVPIFVGACVISEEAVPVAVEVTSGDGSGIQLLKNGSAGVNPCYIGGIAGTLSYDGSAGRYYFTRASKGEAVRIEAGSRLTTDGMVSRRKGDVLIIFSGTNDGPDASSIYDIIEVQRAMLDYADCKKYVIIGLTCKKVMPEIEEVNKILAKEYGEHFLDIRSYLLSYGLAEAGLTPTAQDRADLKNGEIPSSLRKDYVHGNTYFYEILAGQVYRKLEYLGYIPNN